jgi:predicted branched-subunit amino acid permease
MAPALPAIGIWGVVTGVAMIQSGLTTMQALGMTFIVYAGSAQLVSLPLFAAAVPLPIIWASAMIVNLRFMIYALGIRPFLRSLSRTRRLVYGVGTMDYLAAAFLRRFDHPPVEQPLLLKDDREAGRQPHLAYFKGAAITGWCVWQTGSIAGILLAQWIPPAWGLEFVATLALLALLLPLVNDRPGLVCVAVASIVSILLAHLPLNLGLLAAVLAAVAAAMLVEGSRGGRNENSMPISDVSGSGHER